MPDLFHTESNLFHYIMGVYVMTFMNRGMQNRRQRIVVVMIISLVLISFIASIVMYAVF